MTSFKMTPNVVSSFVPVSFSSRTGGNAGEAHRATCFSKIFVLDLLPSLAQENVAACVPCCQPFVFFSYGVLLSHADFNLSS